MSEISPPSRPMMVHELYPAPSSSELRKKYATEGQNTEETKKADEAYRASEARMRETHQGQYVEESAEVVAYEKNTQFKSIARFGNKYYTLIPL